MTAMLRCSNCGRSVPKDKAIKRFQVRNIVDASSQRDIRDASLYQQYMLPKLFIKIQYCASCALPVALRKLGLSSVRVKGPGASQRSAVSRQRSASQLPDGLSHD